MSNSLDLEWADVLSQHGKDKDSGIRHKSGFAEEALKGALCFAGAGRNVIFWWLLTVSAQEMQ